MKSWPSPSSLPDLSDHQREQYARAARGCLALWGGRPGSGKTFTMARIIGALPQGRLGVCAPTGKAATRMSETLIRAGVKGIRATTIHSLLGPGRDEETDTWAFEHDEGNPLDLDWIFVDESSMIPTDLMASLMAARAPGARIAFFGDTNQLSPVGHGAPLRDLAAAGLPYAEFREIRRNSGRIVLACHGIVDRQQFEPSPKLDLAAESPENLLHIEKREPEAQIETLKTVLDRFSQGATLAVRRDDGTIEQRRVDPVWDVQPLLSVNEKSPLSRVRINGILQSFLNPCGESVKGCQFRKGDKIVLGKNSWCIAETDRPRGLIGGPWNENAKDGKVYACNGDIACVLSVLSRYTVARLFSPDRLVRIPHGEQQTNEDGEEVGSGNDWQLAYGLSVHKSQGSEFPVAIFMVDEYPGARMLGTRELLYTALSRARIMAVTIGQRDLCDEMCRKTGIHSRKTFLKEEITSLGQQAAVQQWEAALA